MYQAPAVAQTERELAVLRKTPAGQQISEIMHDLYPADPLLEPELEGKTYFQVAVLRQALFAAQGSLGSLEFLLDRTEGKAVQHNQNVNIGGSYKDFLQKVKEREAEFEKDGVVDADIV